MKAIVLNELDNVATAVVDIPQGDNVEVVAGMSKYNVSVVEFIPFGYKFAIRQISEGEAIYKYGMVIGHSKENIALGVMVHSHNVG